MKRFYLFLLTLCLLLTAFVGCTPEGTQSDDNTSADWSTEISSQPTDISDDISTDESETDSDNRFEILDDLTDSDLMYEVEETYYFRKALSKYNEYVLIKNLCEGSVEIDKSQKVEKPKFEILDWFTVDFTSDEYWAQEEPFGFVPEKYKTYYDHGYPVTDERFKHHDDFKTMVYDIFEEELAEFNYNYFFGCTDHFGKVFEYPTSYPPFITDNGVLYSVIEFNEYAELPERYIDLDSIKVYSNGKEAIVTARGSSVFEDGEVQSPDSDVKILFDEDRKIVTVRAVRDHIGSLDTEYSSEFEKIKAMMERYWSFNDIFETTSNINTQKVNNRYTIISMYDIDFSLCESDIFRSFTDVYDWLSITEGKTLRYPYIYPPYLKMLMGFYSTYDYIHSSFITYTKDGLMVTKDEFDIFQMSCSVDEFCEDFFDKCELEIKNGQIVFTHKHSEFDEENGGYLFEELILKRVDEFGDGDYTYKIVSCESKYVK